MAHRRVICDSEDEEGDYSDLDSPTETDDEGTRTRFALTAAQEQEDGGDQRPPGQPNSDARSTDPDFFRRIYEDQQNAAASFIPDTLREDAAAHVQPETGSSSVSSAAAAATVAAVKQQPNTSSSLTDPTLRSSLKKGKGAADPSKDFADMTQVTTPGAPAVKRKDIYDFDFSDGEGAVAGPSVLKPKFKANTTTKAEATATKADGKRKRSTPKVPPSFVEGDARSSPPQLSVRAHGSSAILLIELDGDDDESPRPTRKKRKSGQRQTAREVPDDVDLLVIPTTADTNETRTETKEDDANLSSIVDDTFEARQGEGNPASASASSLVIVPPSLTASQKQQYLRISGSSELDQEKFAMDDQQQASLPAPRSQTQGLRSTATESTIPYTTPSRYCSSAAPLGDLEVQSGHNLSDPSSERKTQPETAQPDCSPDELSTLPVETMSRAKKRKSPPELEDELAQDDSWDSDKVGFSRENYVPKPSKRRSRPALQEEDEVVAPEESMPDTCPPGDIDLDEPQGARKVPIDEAQAAQSLQADELDPDFLAAMPDDIRQEILNNFKTPGYTQTARTRSRARPDEASGGPVMGHEETPQPKKRGRKKKVPANDDIALAADEAEAQPSPAQVASVKRKRGRPKKTEPAPAPAIEEDKEEDQPAGDESGRQAGITDEPRMRDSPSIEDAEKPSQATKTTRKRGRKKKTTEEIPKSVHQDTGESTREAGGGCELAQDKEDALEQNPETQTEEPSEDTANGGREALRDISNTVADKIPATDDADSEIHGVATPESKSKDNKSKAASTISQADKVRFRVGLSKRSRIAPLLKIIRK